MTGYCKDCKKEENCKKDIGFIWGFCYADFEPKENRKDNEYGAIRKGAEHSA